MQPYSRWLWHASLFREYRWPGRPDKGLGVLVMFLNVSFERRFQLPHAMKDAPAKALLREVAKEPFHHVEPGCAGGGEVHVEAPAPSEPAFHLGMFVRGVVIHDEMHFAVRRRLGLDEAQEAQPFLVPVLAHAGSSDSPVQAIEG